MRNLTESDSDGRYLAVGNDRTMGESHGGDVMYYSVDGMKSIGVVCKLWKWLRVVVSQSHLAEMGRETASICSETWYFRPKETINGTKKKLGPKKKGYVTLFKERTDEGALFGSSFNP